MTHPIDPALVATLRKNPTEAAGGSIRVERRNSVANRYRIAAGLAGILFALLTACQTAQPEGVVHEGTVATLQVESTAFAEGQAIPPQYTCDGADVSPPVSWSGAPEGTQSFVLILDDPDAPGGTWDHWILFNIPATTRSLPEAVPGDENVEGIGVHGSNSWRHLGYGGPCPPPGPAHGYAFRVYALDSTLDLEAGIRKRDVEQAMIGHVLATGQLIGRYGR